MSNQKSAKDTKFDISSKKEKIVPTNEELALPVNNIDLFANPTYSHAKKDVTTEVLEMEEAIEKELPKTGGFKYVSKIVFDNANKTVEEPILEEEFGTEKNPEEIIQIEEPMIEKEEEIDEFLEKIRLEPIEVIESETVEVIEEDQVLEDNASAEEMANILEAIKSAEITKNKLTNQIKQMVQVKYDTIQNKATKLLVFCNFFEQENKDLEQQVIQVIRDSYESIDEIKESVRRESLKENDIGYKIQKLKCKIMELDEINNKIGRFLSETHVGYTEIGLATIKELENKLNPLETRYKILEGEHFSLMQKRSELLDTLNFRSRMLKLSRTDREYEFQKLQVTCQLLEQGNKEILERLNNTKVTMHENTVNEKNKYGKMTEELRQSSEKLKILLREKTSLQNENNYLQDKIHKILHELDFLPN